MVRKYSEMDIQDYAAGRFKGNHADLEQFIQENPLALAHFSDYRELYNVLNKEKAPGLSFDLSTRVVMTIRKRSTAKESYPYYFSQAMLAFTAIGALIFIIQNFNLSGIVSSFTNHGILIAAVILMSAFIYGFYAVEMKQRKAFWNDAIV